MQGCMIQVRLFRSMYDQDQQKQTLQSRFRNKRPKDVAFKFVQMGMGRFLREIFCLAYVFTTIEEVFKLGKIVIKPKNSH